MTLLYGCLKVKVLVWPCFMAASRSRSQYDLASWLPQAQGLSMTLLHGCLKVRLAASRSRSQHDLASWLRWSRSRQDLLITQYLAIYLPSDDHRTLEVPILLHLLAVLTGTTVILHRCREYQVGVPSTNTRTYMLGVPTGSTDTMT